MTRALASQREETARWASVHLRGDRNPAIALTDRRVRRGVGTATTVRTAGKGGGLVYE